MSPFVWNHRMALQGAIANQECAARYHLRMVEAREAGLSDRAELAMDRSAWHSQQARWHMAQAEIFARKMGKA